jgi:metal-responsive CopG/Arc/MetJ family transcriptional regulator
MSTRGLHLANGNGSEPITLTIPGKLREAMDARAARCGESRSAYIRRLVEADLRECGVTA